MDTLTALTRLGCRIQVQVIYIHLLRVVKAKDYWDSTKHQNGLTTGKALPGISAHVDPRPPLSVPMSRLFSVI